MASTKEHAATVLLSRAHSPTTTTDIFRDKIQNRPLLLRPSSPDPKENARTARQVSRQKAALALRRSKKPKPLSAKQKRALGVYDIPKEQRKYSIYEPLCRMWCGYIREVLGVSVDDQGQQSDRYLTPAGAGPMLASADFHGALLEVVRSRCVSRVGIKGIVVKDRKFSFEIITRKNELKTVPKEHTVFKFEIPLDREGDTSEATRPLIFELYGSQFETRAPDRANKKFKMHIDPDL